MSKHQGILYVLTGVRFFIALVLLWTLLGFCCNIVGSNMYCYVHGSNSSCVIAVANGHSHIGIAKEAWIPFDEQASHIYVTMPQPSVVIDSAYLSIFLEQSEGFFFWQPNVSSDEYYAGLDVPLWITVALLIGMLVATWLCAPHVHRSIVDETPNSTA